MSNTVNERPFFVNSSTLKPTVGTTSEDVACPTRDAHAYQRCITSGAGGHAAPSVRSCKARPRRARLLLRTFFGLSQLMMVDLPLLSSPTQRIRTLALPGVTAPNSFLNSPIAHATAAKRGATAREATGDRNKKAACSIADKRPCRIRPKRVAVRRERPAARGRDARGRGADARVATATTISYLSTTVLHSGAERNTNRPPQHTRSREPKRLGSRTLLFSPAVPAPHASGAAPHAPPPAPVSYTHLTLPTICSV
eukprot:6202625-Prymnesium_polylepis.1